MRRVVSGIRRAVNNVDGNLLPLMLVLIFVLLSLSVILSEIYRIHGIHSHLEYELQRAVNIAVEDAMEDSWRQDKLNKLDAAKARSFFFYYLQNDLGLSGGYQKIGDGKIVYTLVFDDIDTQIDPPRLLVSGHARVRSEFAFLVDDIRIPFTIRSKNFRIDGL
jgi:hypothetical protein